MNKNNRKKKGLSKKVLALMLCCFCLLATIPIYAFALETEETQMTEESISEQQSENTGESLLSLSSETSESQTETDTQQSTSDEIIEPILENETDTEVETEVNTETGTEANTETETEADAAGSETETGSEAEVNAATESEADSETESEAGEATETEPSYLEQLDTYYNQAVEAGPDADDAVYAEIYNGTMAVYAAAGSPSAEDDPDIYNAVGMIVMTLQGYGYDPYAVEISDTVTAEQVLETFEHTASGRNNQTSNVYLAVRRDGNIPGEPSNQSSASYNFYNGQYSAGFGTFATCPKGFINENIVDYQNFIFTSVDGTDTAGLVDSTGITTNQVLSGINFDALLDAIANAGRNGRVTATDGQIVTTANKDNYKVVCYVIKLQLDTSYGWHIDCAVVPKTYVTLSYDINIPDGYEIQTSGVGVPNSKTGLPPATFNVGAMDGLTTIDGEQNAIKVVNANDSAETYVFMFQGWNTKADGSGTWYEPNSSITIEENTVLYAIWDSNPAMGTGNLEIQKIVNADVITDDAFTFQVTIKNADGSESTDTYNYVIYDSNTIAQSRGTITSGGTISLKHTQYVEIQDLPAVNEEGGQPNVTIQETDHEGYDASWDGGTTVSDTTSVAIQGGRDSRVTCMNTVSAPKVCNLTIKKMVSGNMYDANEEFDFTVTYGGETKAFSLKKDGSYTIENIPVGVNVTVTESPDGYTYSFVSITEGVTKTDITNGVSFTMPSQDVTVVINNDKTVSVDTGISLETVPYILILAVVVIGAVLLIKRRRNRYYD